MESDEVRRGDNLDRFNRCDAIVVRHDPDQPAAISVRQRPQQHRVDDAEHGGRQTNAEGEGATTSDASLECQGMSTTPGKRPKYGRPALSRRSAFALRPSTVATARLRPTTSGTPIVI